MFEVIRGEFSISSSTSRFNLSFQIIQHFHVAEPEAKKDYEMIYTTFGQVKTPPKFIFTPR